MFGRKRKNKESPKEQDYKEQLISDLHTLKLVIGLSRVEKEILDEAINYIETH